MGQKENQRYQQKVTEASPRSPVWKNCFLACLVGGSICARRAKSSYHPIPVNNALQKIKITETKDEATSGSIPTH